MNKEKKEKLKLILKEKLLELQKLSYEELCQFIDNPKGEQYGENEDFYQIEIESFWDNPKEKTNLRVVASIDDGGIRAFFLPLSNDFIITPDGKFL